MEPSEPATGFDLPRHPHPPPFWYQDNRGPVSRNPDGVIGEVEARAGGSLNAQEGAWAPPSARKTRKERCWHRSS